MKIGIICPVAHLQEFATRSTFHLILPHLYEEFPAYKEFYTERAKQGDFVVQDSSIFELEHSMPGEQLLELAEEVGANEMVTPEVLLDAEASKRKLTEFLETYTKRGATVALQSVVQGKTIEEMCRYWAYLLTIREVSTIGVPFDIDIPTDVTKGIQSKTLRRVLNRWHLMDLAERANLLKKPVHLMGLSDAVELQHYDHPMIRSNDSSSAFVHGAEMVYYQDRGLPCEKISKKLDFGVTLLEQEQITAVHSNISRIQQFARAL